MADIGCGNGKYLGINKNMYNVSNNTNLFHFYTILILYIIIHIDSVTVLIDMLKNEQQKKLNLFNI